MANFKVGEIVIVNSDFYQELSKSNLLGLIVRTETYIHVYIPGAKQTKSWPKSWPLLARELTKI